LPVELYRPIAQCIRSKGALCAFARVSRATQSDAERFIYREFTAKTTTDIVVLLKRVVSLKRIAPYVFSLDIKHRRLFSVLRSPPTPTGAFFQLISSALRLLTGLRHLTIDFSELGQEYNISCSFIFNHVPFRLYSFASSLSWDGRVVQFLLNQPDIIYLSFLSFPWYPGIIPHRALRKLRAVHTVIYHFTWTNLPNRPLTHLSINRIRDTTLPENLRSVRVLKLTTIPANLPALVPDLEVFCGLDIDEKPVRKRLAPFQ
jgi:hypothetical protein